jgi:hypothetical protein
VGVVIGGECSLGAVLVSESCAKEKKLFALCVMNSSFPVGAALTGLFDLGTGVFGWRFLFAVGVLPALQNRFPIDSTSKSVLSAIFIAASTADKCERTF